MEEKYIQKIAETEQRAKSNTHRLDKLEENNKLMMKLCSSVELLAQKQEQAMEQIQDLKADVVSIKETPKKRYDLIVTTIITVVVTALVTAFVTGVFK
ncbi:hypothetical protein [Vallitalea guaymasensis]|uniref:hypothetical protein n=1 Tax=Vallitalea guaymasensis TaxID=1185412 RepID=UPI000DE432F6|nr:hypothetical protein [Vallitalea guaymasensis]